MAAQRAADNQHVACAKLLSAPVNIGGDRPHPGGVDKSLSAAPLHHLGIPGDDSDPASRAVCAMLLTTAVSVSIGNPSSRINPQER